MNEIGRVQPVGSPSERAHAQELLRVARQLAVGGEVLPAPLTQETPALTQDKVEISKLAQLLYEMSVSAEKPGDAASPALLENLSAETRSAVLSLYNGIYGVDVAPELQAFLRTEEDGRVRRARFEKAIRNYLSYAGAEELEEGAKKPGKGLPGPLSQLLNWFKRLWQRFVRYYNG